MTARFPLARRRRSPLARLRRAPSAVLAALLVASGAVTLAACSGGNQTSTRSGAHASVPTRSGTDATPRSAAFRSVLQVVASAEPWRLQAPVSRETLEPAGGELLVVGGLTASGSSSNGLFVLDPTDGALALRGVLADPVHDAGSAVLDGRLVVFGGGSPDTVATVQAIALPGAPGTGPAGSISGTVIGQLPQPRSDLSVATLTTRIGGHPSTTAYVVGGYDGATYLPEVLATADGTTYQQVAALPVPVRYAAVAAAGGKIFAFGGETPTGATDDIQMIDPEGHRATIVGHLPVPLYGASAVSPGGRILVIGGFSPGGSLAVGGSPVTHASVLTFDPATAATTTVAALPGPEAFAAAAVTGSGVTGTVYVVGGEVTATATNSAGSLATVDALRQVAG